MTEKKPVGWRGESIRHAQAARGIQTGVMPKVERPGRSWPPTPTKPKKTGYEVVYKSLHSRTPKSLHTFHVDAASEKEAGRAVKKYYRYTYDSGGIKIVRVERVPVDEWGRRRQAIDSEGKRIDPYID